MDDERVRARLSLTQPIGTRERTASSAQATPKEPRRACSARDADDMDVPLRGPLPRGLETLEMDKWNQRRPVPRFIECPHPLADPLPGLQLALFGEIPLSNVASTLGSSEWRRLRVASLPPSPRSSTWPAETSAATGSRHGQTRRVPRRAQREFLWPVDGARSEDLLQHSEHRGCTTPTGRDTSSTCHGASQSVLCVG